VLLAACEQDAATLAKWVDNSLEGNRIGEAERYAARLRARVTAEAARLRAENPAAPGPIPDELLTSSGSGLDPDVSPDAARFQVDRVSTARGLDNEAKKRLIELVEKQIKQPDFGILGEPRINVLRLNLALDSAFVE